jgi:hypothetical protein
MYFLNLIIVFMTLWGCGPSKYTDPSSPNNSTSHNPHPPHNPFPDLHDPHNPHKHHSPPPSYPYSKDNPSSGYNKPSSTDPFHKNDNLSSSNKDSDDEPYRGEFDSKPSRESDKTPYEPYQKPQRRESDKSQDSSSHPLRLCSPFEENLYLLFLVTQKPPFKDHDDNSFFFSKMRAFMSTKGSTDPSHFYDEAEIKNFKEFDEVALTMMEFIQASPFKEIYNTIYKSPCKLSNHLDFLIKNKNRAYVFLTNYGKESKNPSFFKEFLDKLRLYDSSPLDGESKEDETTQKP